MNKNKPFWLKLLTLVLVSSTLLTMTSCKDDDPDAAFRLEFDVELEYPAGLNVFETHFLIRDLRTRVQQAANSAGVSLDEVVAVRTSLAILTSTFAGGNLQIVEEAIVDVYPVFDPNDRYEAAYTIQVPNEPINSIQMVGSSNNLVDVMLMEEFTLELGLRFRATTQAPLPVRLRITMDALI